MNFDSQGERTSLDKGLEKIRRQNPANNNSESLQGAGGRLQPSGNRPILAIKVGKGPRGLCPTQKGASSRKIGVDQP